MHVTGYGTAMRAWPNEAIRSQLDGLAAPRSARQQSPQGRLRAMAKEVGREERTGPPGHAEAVRMAIEGITSSAETAGALWRSQAVDFVMAYAKTHAEVFCDDLWSAGLPPSDSDRALGWVLRHLSRSGVLVNSGVTRPSQRSNNSSAKVVWRSAIFEGERAADPAQ